MGLLPNPLPIAWRLEQVCIVDSGAGVLRIFLVKISFLIFMITDVFERESLHLHLAPVHDDALIQRPRSDAVLHSTHNLELVLVNGADVGYGRCRKSRVLVLIFFNEGLDNLREAESVFVRQMHLKVWLDRLNVHLHHLR